MRIVDVHVAMVRLYKVPGCYLGNTKRIENVWRFHPVPIWKLRNVIKLQIIGFIWETHVPQKIIIPKSTQRGLNKCIGILRCVTTITRLDTLSSCPIYLHSGEYIHERHVVVAREYWKYIWTTRRLRPLDIFLIFISFRNTEITWQLGLLEPQDRVASDAC